MREIVSPLDGFLSPFGRSSGSGAAPDAYAIGGASPELVAAFLTQADGTTEGEYFRTGGVEDDFSMFTFSRSDNATMFDSTGTLVWAPHNLLEQSEAFNAGDWSRSDVTVTANATTAPDGTVTADLIIPNTVNNFHRFFQSGFDSFRGVVACFVKNYGWQWIGLRVGNDVQSFDILNGVKGTGSAGIVDSDIVSVGGGWYLIWAESLAADLWLIQFADEDTTDKNPGFAANGTDGAYFWGAHFYRSDLGGMADNPDQPAGLEKYVPTTSAAVYLSRRNAYYYDSGWTKGGLQLESAAATNLHTDTIGTDMGLDLFSEVSASAWVDGPSKKGLTVTASATNNSHLFRESLTTANTTIYTAAVYAEEDTHRYLQILVNSNTGAVVNFDLRDGSINAIVTTAAVGYGAIPFGDGFICWLAFTSNGITNYPVYGLVTSLSAARAESWTALGTESIKIDMLQFEAGSTPSSYIPTTGSTVTRAAETLSVAAANLPYSATAMSISMKGLMTYADDNLTTQSAFYNWSLSASDNIQAILATNSTRVGELRVSQDSTTDGANSLAVQVFNPGVNVPFNISSRHLPSEFQLAYDGTTSSIDSDPTVLPDLSATDIVLGGNGFNGFISEFRMWGTDIGDSGIAGVTS